MGRATVIASCCCYKKDKEEVSMYQTFDDGDGNGNKARRQSLLPIESSNFEVIWRLRQRRDGGGTFFSNRLD